MEHGPSLRILVAEDDGAMAQLYALYAQRRGHQVILARDGVEALASASAEMPDIIILDIALPGLDGRDVCRQLKTNPRTEAIPILVVSALAGDQNMRGMLVELGAGDVVEKPADLQIAFNKAERLAARAHARTPAPRP